MLQYEKISISEGIDINKINASKECMLCRYWYFKDVGFKFEPHVCNKCHDILMTAYELKNIAILNVKGVDSRCILWGIDDDTRLLRHPLTSFCRPYALAWAATMIGLRPTTYAYLFTRVLPLATLFQGFHAFSGLRLLYYVIPTALKHIYVMRFLYSRGLAVICTAMLHFACLH